jgi:hypothetical protein
LVGVPEGETVMEPETGDAWTEGLAPPCVPEREVVPVALQRSSFKEYTASKGSAQVTRHDANLQAYEATHVRV